MKFRSTNSAMKVVSKYLNDLRDYCEIDIVLNTPKNKIFKFNPLFQQLLSYFPNLMTILNKFIQFLRIKI